MLPCSQPGVCKIRNSLLYTFKPQYTLLPWLQGKIEPNPFDLLLTSTNKLVTKNNKIDAKATNKMNIGCYHVDLQEHSAMSFLIHAFNELYRCRQV